MYYKVTADYLSMIKKSPNYCIDFGAFSMDLPKNSILKKMYSKMVGSDYYQLYFCPNDRISTYFTDLKHGHDRGFFPKGDISEFIQKIEIEEVEEILNNVSNS